MRLTSFTLHRYGNFEAERIRFDPTPGTINILLAPNSAGKSVFRNAFLDLLFRIHNQTQMDFRFGYAGMRLTADIVRPNGETATFSRRKTLGNVVMDAADKPLDAGFLPGFLGDRDRTLLERLFVLDTEALRMGSKALLDSDGDVASALLSAAGGIRQARALKRRLEEQRDERAPLRKTASRPFYQALDAFHAARARTRADMLKPDEWFRRERDLASLERRLLEQNAAADIASADIARLERIRRVRPALMKFDEAMAWLKAHSDGRVLAARLGEHLTEARLDVAAKEQTASRIHENLANTERDAALIEVDEAVLASGDDIERLIDEAGAARKAREDLPGIQGQYEHRLMRLGDLLRQLGSTLPPERANEVVPTAAIRARARELMKQHGEIISRLTPSVEQIAIRRRALAALEDQIGTLPPEPDLGSLESLVASIGADGDPAALLSTAERAVRATEAAVEQAQGLVPGWNGDVAEITARVLLTPDIYIRHEKDVATALNDARAAELRLADEARRLDEARTVCDNMSRLGFVPDAAALAEARARRDEIWRRIALMEDKSSLAFLFEQAIIAADQIADRRFAEAELVTRIDNALGAVANSERNVELMTEHLRIENEKLTRCQAVWARLCASLRLGDAPSLSDIQAFRHARDRAIEAIRHKDAAASALALLSRRQDSHAGLLSRFLKEDTGDLPVLLALAERRLTSARRSQAERLRLETQRAQAARELADTAAARALLDKKLATWQQRWSIALKDIGRPDDEEPVATDAVLEIVAEIASEHAVSASLRERIDGMSEIVARFTRAASLVATANPGDPFMGVRDLDRALKRERALDQRRRVLLEALEAARASAATADQACTEARAAFRAILDVIGTDTIEEAERILARSAERARHEAQRDAAEAELAQSGDGLSYDVLRAEGAQVPPDDLAARIEAVTAARKNASEAAQLLAVEVNESRRRMDHDAEDNDINKAAADQQAAQAAMSRTLDEALVYHTASVLLGRALDVVEKSGDSGLLRRLDDIFQTLTNGAYTRVVTELDDTGRAEFALIQRDFPEERQKIEHLSEGTRDQFFLALRVAAIEDHLGGAAPLPFIGDDILQTFDDDRAFAALRVLTTLSQHKQVIVLTHHRHIIDLASRLPAGSVFICQRESAAATAI